jgi:hypothetical protein
MFAVRYVALLALVFWLGAMLSETLRMHPTSVAGFAFGIVLIACLLILKLLGPPPHHFIARLAIAVTMITIAAYARLRPSTAPTIINLALGCVLLSWYAHE